MHTHSNIGQGWPRAEKWLFVVSVLLSVTLSARRHTSNNIKEHLEKKYKDAVLPFILFTLNVPFNYKNNRSPLENGGR